MSGLASVLPGASHLSTLSGIPQISAENTGLGFGRKYELPQDSEELWGDIVKGDLTINVD
jgi:hypothetical protein